MTPVECATVTRNLEAIQILVELGANMKNVASIVEKGVRGGYEAFELDAEGYQGLAQLLKKLGHSLKS